MSEVPGAPAPSLDGRHFQAVADERLRLHETWAWESHPGAGTSVVEEVI